MLLCKLLKRVLNDYDHTTLINSPDQQSCSDAQNLKSQGFKVNPQGQGLDLRGQSYDIRSRGQGLQTFVRLRNEVSLIFIFIRTVYFHFKFYFADRAVISCNSLPSYVTRFKRCRDKHWSGSDQVA